MARLSVYSTRLRASRLEGQLTAARVDALTARLRPHFLYNALNTISTLVLEDPKAANGMIARLSELLRQVFDRAEEKEVAMEDECRLLEHYVSIQQMRFGESLRVRFLVDPSTLRARVPPLILQPLVENAIAHGADLGANGPSKARAVSIDVEAHRSRQRLVLTVRDDGPGFPYGVSSTRGTGLTSTRARLAELYGASYRLELTNVPSGGAAVRIEIPFNTDASADRRR